MKFNPDPERGYLPKKDPLTILPAKFRAVDELGTILPDLIKERSVRKFLVLLKPISVSGLCSLPQIRRARMIYSFAASAYVYPPGEEPAKIISAGIAVPLIELSRKLGMPPIMSYTDYALNNWRRKDPREAIEVGNLELLQKFSDIPDEAGFILPHVEIEAEAGQGLDAITKAKKAVQRNDPWAVATELYVIGNSLRDMHATLGRIQESCSPEVYYHSVRPYLFGFKGVMYEGAHGLRNRRRTLRGETGAQSSVVPSFVAALGIKHKAASDTGEKNPLLPHMRVMRYYMPPEHRAFIQATEREPSIREYVLRHMGDFPLLKEVYNEDVKALVNFRREHYGDAKLYIHGKVANPEGSGGTLFMKWLQVLIDETEAHLIP